MCFQCGSQETTKAHETRKSIAVLFHQCLLFILWNHLFYFHGCEERRSGMCGAIAPPCVLLFLSPVSNHELCELKWSNSEQLERDMNSCRKNSREFLHECGLCIISFGWNRYNYNYLSCQATIFICHQDDKELPPAITFDIDTVVKLPATKVMSHFNWIC